MPEILWCDYAFPGADLTGYAGVVRYLQTHNGSTRSKYDLTAAEVAMHHKAGRSVGLFWQDGKSSAGLGFDRGVRDAFLANAEADEIGAPKIAPIHYAVDDSTLTVDKVLPYFQGAQSVPGRPVGAYGSFSVVEGLAARLGISWLIQTSSWSGGKVSPHAWLLQRDHDIVSGTSRIDRDPLLREFGNAWRPPVATSMTPAQRKAALIAEGLSIVEVRQWQTNDRAPATGLPAGPKVGCVLHHTGGETSNPPLYASTTLYNGRSDLPGPLCHDGLDIDKGVVYMVGNGRTNHAGKGDSNTRKRVVADTLPLNGELRPTLNDIDGNSAYYGLEMMYAGARALPQVGWDAMIRWTAAHCRFHGWGASAIGHREHTNTKPDPGRVDLAAVRRDLLECLALPAGAWRRVTTPPPPDPEEPEVKFDTYMFTRKSDGATFASTPTGVRQLNGEMYGTLLNLGVKVDPENMDDGPCAALIKSLGGIVPAGPDDDDKAEAAPDSAPGATESSDALPECADPTDPTNA